MFNILDSDIDNDPGLFKQIIIDRISQTRDIKDRYLALIKYSEHFCRNVDDLILFIKNNKIGDVNYYYYLLNNTSKFNIFGHFTFYKIIELVREYCIENDYNTLLDRYKAEGVIMGYSTKFILLSTFYFYCRTQILLSIIYLILKFNSLSILTIIASILGSEHIIHSLNFIYLFLAKFAFRYINKIY